MTDSLILRRKLAALLVASTAISSISANAQEAMIDDQVGAAEVALSPAEPVALFDIPLEDLLTLETTSVAKKRQQVRDSAAAAYVITQEDIRRSAASTIPDLLRMVPGVEVAQVNTGGTAVSIRGLNSRVSNSVLVMIDGRSIYVSAVSGVFWDQLLLPLSDIERIEVVRGPGATLWGSSAANGVINIITKHSSDSLGLTAVARASSRNQEASLSYAGRVADDLSFRIYGDVRRNDGLVDAAGNDQSTHWDGQSIGARVDWEPSERDAFTLQSEYADGNFDIPFLQVRSDLLNPGYDPIVVEDQFKTFNVLGRWARQQTDNLDWSLQVQHNSLQRSEFSLLEMDWNMTDVDFGLHWQASDVHDFNFGVGARVISDSLNTTPEYFFTPSSETDRWISGYVQDDISLIPDTLRLTVGAKLEYNNFTGFEIQPSAKLFFRPDPDIAIWGGVSRAIVTPARFARSSHIEVLVALPGSPRNPTPLPFYSQLNGVPDSESETVDALEAGFRADLSRNWTLDVAGYYNTYDKLTSPTLVGTELLFAPSVPFPVGVEGEIEFQSRGKARTWGVEAVLKGEVASWWNLELSYSHFNYELSIDPTNGQPFELLFPLDGSPQHQARLHNSFDIGDHLSADVDLRHVSHLLGGVVPAYDNVDFRITYRPVGELELSIIGENLLQKRRVEFLLGQYPIPLSYVSRSISAEIRHRF